MMSSKENFDDLKASFDDDLEQLNQEFDQLLLKKLSLEHALEQDQLFDELAQEDEKIDKLAANRPDLDAAIKDQLERCQKKRLQKHTLQSLKKISRRAAAFLVVFLAGFTVLFFTVDAVKLNVVEFIVRSHEMFTQFRMEDMFGNMPEDIPELTESSFRRPSYIPERFSEVSFHFIPGHGYVGYECQDTPYILSYSCMELSTSISLDTEDCMRESVSVNGYSAYLYTKYRGDLKGNTSLIWHDENYIYLISGPVNQHEILKIAESLY